MSVADKLKGLLSKKIMYGATVAAALFFMLVGVIFWGGFNTAMEATNTMEFCVSCHEMEDNVYKEYQQTIHYTNRSGVRASCSDCHVPDPWVHKVVRKIKASNELLHKALGSIDTPEKFDAKRLQLAKNVWYSMKDTDSRECRNCHDFETMTPETQKPRARKQHLNAMQEGNTCIDCHKGIAHKPVHDQLSDEEAEALSKPVPENGIGIPQHWQTFLDNEAKEKAEQKRLAEEAAMKAAEEAKRKAEEKQRLAAESADVTEVEAKAKTAVKTNSPASASGITWAAIPARDITVFYPGQASIEWILGREHGGKRSFSKGDRCIDCHEEELADIGSLISSGEKLEDKDLGGKEGSIKVQVKAAHDAKNLYMNFSWDDTEHQPLGFVDGGKMDVENEIKLAFMIATDDVEYADRAGCWGTCHADLNEMPYAPEGQDVTKYIKESRTKLELKGRNDKPLGGWDKRKTEEEIAQAYNDKLYMDLVRVKSSGQAIEEGRILEDRHMDEAIHSKVSIAKDGQRWVVNIMRPLKTGSQENIDLDLGQTYNFGFAIHDDHTNGRYHHVSLGYKLGFDNADAEINALAQ